MLLDLIVSLLVFFPEVLPPRFSWIDIDKEFLAPSLLWVVVM
ncbi:MULTISPECIES: hypothetical protein [Candidatus Ichthyocystis]|nr:MULTISPECIES: hypothetical protein [Ichthyocystis]